MPSFMLVFLRRSLILYFFRYSNVLIGKMHEHSYDPYNAGKVAWNVSCTTRHKVSTFNAYGNDKKQAHQDLQERR